MLSEEDQDFLDRLGLPYEVHKETTEGRDEVHVTVSNVALGQSYQPETADLLLRLPPGFPATAPDMFWIFPWVKLKTGGDPVQSSYSQNMCGKTWQRWSRHFQSGWRPFTDNLESYFAAVRKEIQRGR